MNDEKLQTLSTDNGVDIEIDYDISDDNLPETMITEFTDGKGGED